MKINCTILFAFIYVITNGQGDSIDFKTFDKTLMKSDFIVEGTLVYNFETWGELTLGVSHGTVKLLVTDCFYNHRKDINSTMSIKKNDTIEIEVLMDDDTILINDSLRNGIGKNFLFLLKQRNYYKKLSVNLVVTNWTSVFFGDDYRIRQHIISNYFIENLDCDSQNKPKTILPDTFSIKRSKALEIAKEKKLYYKDKNGWEVSIRPDGDKKQWIVQCSTSKGNTLNGIKRRFRILYIDISTGEIVDKKRMTYHGARGGIKAGPK